jgi:hypothetical protein
MFGKFTKLAFIILFLCLGASRARADTYAAGILSFDSLDQPSSTPFGLDITNLTQQPFLGSPIVTPLDLSNLTLLVDFSDGSSASEPLTAVDAFGDFTTGAIFEGGSVTDATLTGTFGPTSVMLDDGSTVNILQAFSATLSDPLGALQDGDFSIFNAESAPVSTPEPGMLLLFLPALAAIFYWGQKGSCRTASSISR